jgi:RNA polymerase sigma factor (sigma-70 family)
MTREDFGDYVRKHYDDFLHFVARHVPGSDAADLVQATLLAAWRCAANILPESPGPYFFTALRNAIVNYWRRQPCRPASAALEKMPDPRASSILGEDQGGLDRRLVDALEQARSSLTDPQLRAFTAFWRFRGRRADALRSLSPAEQAGFDCALHRARARLRAMLGPHRALLSVLGVERTLELISRVFGVPSSDQ